MSTKRFIAAASIRPATARSLGRAPSRASLASASRRIIGMVGRPPPKGELSAQSTGRATSVPVEAYEVWQTVIEHLPVRFEGLPDAIAIL